MVKYFILTRFHVQRKKPIFFLSLPFGGLRGMPLLSIMFMVSYFQNRQGLFVNYSSGAKYTLPSNSRIFFKRKVVGWFPIQFLTSQGLTYVAVFSRDSQGFLVRHVFLVVGLYSKTVFIWSFKTMTLKQTGKIPTNSKLQ